MKKIALLFIILIGMSVTAQEKKNISETKMEVFLSKTGVIRKFIDFNLESIRSIYDNSKTRVRKIIIDNESKYFFQIEKTGKYGDKTASIEYTDLLEIMKAIIVLKESTESDIALAPDYLENKFVTVDGFQVGYYVTKSKLKWYLKLEKYGNDDTIFIDDIEILEQILKQAKTKIEELKA
ncbi:MULTISPECIES: hypothetical protein [unclassified Myroides]|uniref:hypothetical protein n=1 Tax=unclassified Myroides TaxID=2642485 RepID=UPI003D2F977C